MFDILRFDYVIERLLNKKGGYERRRLKELSGVDLSKAEAQAAWQRILEHKRHLSKQLDRDVGMKVAAIDYFENIEPPNYTLRPKRYFKDTLPPTLPMMRPLMRRM